MKSICLYFFILCSCPAAYAQFSPQSFSHDTLAIIDKYVITARDMYERISMMPYEDKRSIRDFESAKRKAIESLVGEYLLSRADIPDDTADWRKAITASVLEKMFMRDALYKREIRGRVTIPPAELSKAMQQYSVRRQLLVVKFPDDERGEQFVKEWKTARRKKKSNREIFSSVRYQYDTLFISFGSVDSVLVSAAFHLHDTNDVLGPVQSQLFGAVGIALVSDEPNPDALNKSMPERRKAAYDMLAERKELQIQIQFVNSIVNGQQMRADTLLFYTVVQKFRKLILRDTAERKLMSGYRYLPDDVYALMSAFRPQLDSPIVRGTFGELKLGEFLEQLFYYDFSIPSMRVRSFAASFFQMIKTIAESEMIAREASRRGLKYDHDVRRDVAVWTNYEKSRRVEFKIADTVVVREWEPYWSLWRSNSELVEKNLSLSVQEILVDDSSAAMSLKQRIAQGNGMDSLARIFTLRKEWKNNGGRSGWFVFGEHPELANKALTLAIGEIGAPLKMKEGFSILKLLGRKFAGDTLFIDSLLRREAKRMRIQHQAAAVNRFIAECAQNFHVEIYYDRLAKAEVSDITMFTRRLIGFGGKINAGPFLLPQWQWVEQWQRLREQVP